MGRLIDANKLIDKFKYIEQRECTAIFVNKIIEIIEGQPIIEAIPKDQYEQRLKADIVAMLTDIQLEIEEHRRNINAGNDEFMIGGLLGIDSCSEITTEN